MPAANQFWFPGGGGTQQPINPVNRPSLPVFGATPPSARGGIPVGAGAYSGTTSPSPGSFNTYITADMTGPAPTPQWLTDLNAQEQQRMQGVVAGTYATDPSNPFSAWNIQGGGPTGFQGYVPPTATPISTPSIQPAPITLGQAPIGGTEGFKPGYGIDPNNPTGPSIHIGTTPTKTQPSSFTPMQQTQQPFDLSSLMNFLPSFFQNQFQSPFQPQSPDSSVIPGWGWGGP